MVTLYNKVLFVNIT